MKFRKRKYNNLKSGYTLVEILVVIFIFTLILIAVYNLQSDSFSLNSLLSQSLTIQNEAIMSLKTMSSEIRTASPSSIGSYPIEQASATSFTFYSNIDSEPLKERVRYFLSGTTLKRGIIKAAGNPLAYNSANEVVNDLVHNVANGSTPIFSYYDDSYDGTTQPLASPVSVPAVRLVKITVIVDANPAKMPAPRTFTTQVSLRNLKDNL
jgi:prepilin-type N-terminal cleavage/methylation domain-containing protein